MTMSKFFPPLAYRWIARPLSAALLLLFLHPLQLSAQGWDFKFGGNKEDYGHAIVQTSDRGYLLVGYSESFANGSDQDFDVYVIKTDVDGTPVWERTYDPGLVEFGRSLQETADGGFLIAGEVSFAATNGPFEGLLLRIDRNGELEWEQTYTIEGVENVRINDLVEANDGGYLMVGYAEYADTTEDNLLLIKVDADGQQQWSQVYGKPELGEQGNAGYPIDDGFVLTGTVAEEDGLGRDMVAYRIDTQGDTIWTRSIASAEDEAGEDIVVDASNDIVIAGINGNDLGLWKYDSDGNLLDEQKQDFFGFGDQAFAIILGQDDDYVVAGLTEVNTVNVDQLIASFDQGLELQWFNHNGDVTDSDEAQGVALRENGGYATVGASGLFLSFVNDVVLTTTNPTGEIYSNYIRGTVFQDLDNACDFDPGELPLKGWLVRAQGEEGTFYGTTDENGVYEILVDTGSYVVQPLPINENWESCQPNGINITFTEIYDSINLNGPMKAALPDCPLMELDVSTPFLAPCSEVNYKLKYANNGTALAEDVRVEVELGEAFELTDASLPFTVSGDVYTFDIGEVDYNAAGQFTIQTQTPCSGILEGQAGVVSAKIFPDTSCAPLSPNWSGASVGLEGSCENDQEIQFLVSNEGDGSMMSERTYFVVEEDLVVFLQEPFELEEGESQTVTIPNPEGKTYRILAEQAPDHPGKSMPTLAIEGCGTNAQGEFSTGFVTQWQEDDADPFKSIHVDEMYADQPAVFLQGHPKGWQDSIITAETELTYRYFFRNTGQDSITTVIIRDTLPEELDISTIETGASSHPAKVEVFSNGVLKVTFEDIALPLNADGSTNTEDFGFFEFRIQQQPGNPPGTVIDNDALVYIENNPPLMTNMERHVIESPSLEELLVNVIPVDTDGPEAPTGVTVDAFPNPASEHITVQVNGLQKNHTLDFSLVNMQGQTVRYTRTNAHQYTFERSQLPAGSYLYKVRSAGSLIASGLLIIR